MITIPISAIVVLIGFIVIGMLFTLLMTTVFCFANKNAWKYTIPIGQLIAFIMYATQQGWIIWK